MTQSRKFIYSFETRKALLNHFNLTLKRGTYICTATGDKVKAWKLYKGETFLYWIEKDDYMQEYSAFRTQAEQIAFGGLSLLEILQNICHNMLINEKAEALQAANDEGDKIEAAEAAEAEAEAEAEEPTLFEELQEKFRAFDVGQKLDVLQIPLTLLDNFDINTSDIKTHEAMLLLFNVMKAAHKSLADIDEQRKILS